MHCSQILSLQSTLNTMTELSHDLDESDVDHNGDEHIREQVGVTDTLLIQGAGSEVPRGLLYLLVLTCGGAG